MAPKRRKSSTSKKDDQVKINIEDDLSRDRSQPSTSRQADAAMARDESLGNLTEESVMSDSVSDGPFQEKGKENLKMVELIDGRNAEWVLPQSLSTPSTPLSPEELSRRVLDPENESNEISIERLGIGWRQFRAHLCVFVLCVITFVLVLIYFTAPRNEASVEAAGTTTLPPNPPTTPPSNSTTPATNSTTPADIE